MAVPVIPTETRLQIDYATMASNKHVSILAGEFNASPLRTRLLDISCYMLVTLGLVGNLLGLLIFSSSRRTWRISSTYVCLATCSSLTNLLCVIRFACLLHSSSKRFLHELVAHTWWACKLFELSFSFRVVASWITLFWMFERVLCVSHRLRQCCARWQTPQCRCFVPMLMLVIILACVVGPPLIMFQPNIVAPEATANSSVYVTHCKVAASASPAWKRYFGELSLGMNHYTVRCAFSELFPAGAIVFFNSFILWQLVRTWRRLQSRHRNQTRTASWMNTVLILHSSLFLLSLLLHIVGHSFAVEAHETWWVQLGILLNCSVNFYIYCLSGKSFRNIIRRFFRRLNVRQQSSY